MFEIRLSERRRNPQRLIQN